MAAVTLADVTLGYNGHPAVHHLDGAFASGSLTAVIGPNGSGKSTLLKGIVGMLSPLGGRILRDVPATDIAYLPQSAEIDRSFPASVADIVALGLWRRRGAFAGISRRDYADIEAALAAVGLIGFENRPLDTLSGGQMQRALFARVLLQDARLILLDEPFTAIDERTAVDLVHLVERWHGEGRTLIAVLHDAELVERVFPQTLLLAREPVAWGDTAGVMCADNLARARHMIEAWDEHAPWHDEHGHDHSHGSAR
jgi:zinc/manganese transport system ATP-binding protein